MDDELEQAHPVRLDGSVTYTARAVDLPGRTTLSYVEHGDRAGVSMILLHGVSDSWHSFELVLPHLPRTVRALALTQRGHGDAGRPVSYRTRDFAADLAALVEVLGLGPAVVVGHSMGSTNALRFAIDYPELTRGLVLAGTFASYRSNGAVRELWASVVSRLADPVDAGFVREFQESTLVQPVPPSFFDTVVRESLKVPARVWRGAFEGFLEDDFVGELDRIRAPTLIVWGARDGLCSRADQEALLAAIRGTRLVAYEGAGHGLHWEEPARFAADLVAFGDSLTGVLPRSAGGGTPRCRD
jgi:pimeloyl-ACP methyl ester carboxylesterase